MAKKRKLSFSKNQERRLKQGKTLQGNRLVVNRKLIDRYNQRISKLTRAMIRDVTQSVSQSFNTGAAKVFYAQDATFYSSQRAMLRDLRKKWVSQFNKDSKTFARWMIEDVENQTSTRLASSLERITGGTAIKTDTRTGKIAEILRSLIDQNVELIRTIPDQYLDQISGEVTRAINNPQSSGIKGLQMFIDSKLKDSAKKTRNRAKNIATDQVRKAFNSMYASRMQSAGIKKFEWIHTGGSQNPRDHHMNTLNGQIFSFDDLPVIDLRTGERGIPGQAINCRCTMRPVVELDSVA